ncbi:MAG: glycolate oxidase subunit GlcF [Gammaproteobacteria bacterium]
MQTSIADFIKDTPQGQEADAILRSCVHCGFCNAACPTYQLLGDELDGPRGRIYLIKQVLEGHAPTAKTQLHLDRCLTCRACESACPSGVRYGELVDIGRAVVAGQVNRSPYARLRRWLLRAIIPYPARFTPLLRIGQVMLSLLPRALRRSVPLLPGAGRWPQATHARTMLALPGCAQSAIAPAINAAAARVLDRLGITLRPMTDTGCCGALSQHLDAHEEARAFARRNIDAWWPSIEAGAEAIVMTASGCGVFVKDYGRLLRDDARYAAKASRVAHLTKDLGEILMDAENLAGMVADAKGEKIAFHSPCTLQHGQRLNGVVETVLTRLGFQLTAVPDAHLCCGSAGTYSLLQRDLAQRLLENKLESLQSGFPAAILTANIGCLTHLQSKARVPVRHWIELIAENIH